MDDSDLIITFGGDGTFIKAANLIENSLIIGINSDPKKSEGALTSLDIENMDKLKDILSGKFNTIIRHRAEVKLNGKVLDEYATNEIFIGTALQFHTSLYKIKFNNKEEYQKSSGIIISTGTGSKAWYKSAGGKPFLPNDKKIAFIVREPYVGKKIFKPKILNGEIKNGEKLIVESNRDFGGILAINDFVYEFNKGDIAEIKISDKPLKVIKLK